jgi:alkylation response protein AidB-like acyl-CoA dehydrogenase
LEQVTLSGMAALCVDMLGAMEAAYRLSIDYLNVRQQFGRLIGQNQALRHRAADMRVHLELGRSAAMAAVIAADRPSAPGSLQEVWQAKLILGRYARLVCESAIQCHGGIGMTEEYAVGHCLRRVHVADHWFGHSQQLAHQLAHQVAHQPADPLTASR